jgi:hypothetical protein
VLFRGVSLLNAIILALFIFNAGGIRLISNSIVTIIIIVLLLIKIQKNKTLDQRFLFITIILFSVILAGNYLFNNAGFSLSNHMVYFSYVISAAMLVAIYRSGLDDFSMDLRLALMFFAFHAFLGFILQFIFEPGFNINFVEGRDIAMLFFYPKLDTFSFIHRNNGLFWEPGVLQLFMNILLYLSLFVNKSKPIAIISMVIIGSTLSTTGLVTMVVLVAYYFYSRLNKNTIIIMPVSLVAVVLIAWAVSINVANKFEVKSSSVRIFDMAVGLAIVKDHPVAGVGLNRENFANEVTLYGGGFQKAFLITDEELADKGLTNGILYLFVTLGIPLSLVLLLLLYKQAALPNRILVAFILITSGSSIPIVQTGFYLIFMIFGFSTFVGSRRKRDKTYFNQSAN